MIPSFLRGALCAVLCILVVLLPGCRAFTAEQRIAGAEAVQAAYDRGELTISQRDAALKALEGATIDWDALLQTGGSVLLSLLLGVPTTVGVVRAVRGPVATAAERAARIAAKA